MELLEIVFSLVVAVIALIVLTGLLAIDRRQLTTARQELRERTRVALPMLGVLGFVLLFNARFRDLGEEISWLVGVNITPLIRRLEGPTVIVTVQSIFGERFELFFSFVYVYGYVFLLVFPLVAYFLLRRLDDFKSLTVAYSANYVIGLFCYIIFIAYGPRNMISGEIVEGYFLPHFQLLTTEVNQNTNVFPSLHTSLSATVMLFAWRTREEYPEWLLIAGFLGTSVIISTMYLAIHWFVDVLAGLLLAYVSYWLGVKSIEREWGAGLPIARRFHRFGSTLK